MVIKVKKLERRFFLVLLFLLIIFYKNYVFVEGTYYHINEDYVTSTLSKYNLDEIDNLMIVAHPDDEMLWGGANLIQDRYLVVCVTCGQRYDRVLEFNSVMSEVDSPYIMLNYPDLTNGKRDDWSTVYQDIELDISKIVNFKDWDKIVTHNPEGEYGHQHHKMTDAIVTNEVVTKIAKSEKLYYFEKYYTKKQIESKNYCLPSISPELLERKKEILKIYKTQAKVVESFSHMIEHEALISYEDWNNYENNKETSE